MREDKEASYPRRLSPGIVFTAIHFLNEQRDLNNKQEDFIKIFAQNYDLLSELDTVGKAK